MSITLFKKPIFTKSLITLSPEYIMIHCLKEVMTFNYMEHDIPANMNRARLHANILTMHQTVASFTDYRGDRGIQFYVFQ